METEATGEDGFTLIELMVVVLVIAILLAVAIPSYMGMVDRAADRAVQTHLRNGLTNQLVVYAERQRFSDVTAELQVLDETLTWTTDAADLDSGATTIWVQVTTTDSPQDTVVIAAKSASDTCYWIRVIGASREPRFATTDCATPPVFEDRW